ncbi:SpaA isopeptide-forming pilin-related protein [Sharpea azabuensis]|uniref:SpaA isopeptide-forming pilin-related protein n=1 Tax=Sharpea azabuensis TaxID=322505 RepID=UPI002409C3CA|nr:SpaA isopeptide-forming pilin-related protein [Sharpea azabuensis]MDD6512022.1 SpaA isopeptide-forming pilin-related protein [Sharpea azabuensis]
MAIVTLYSYTQAFADNTIDLAEKTNWIENITVKKNDNGEWKETSKFKNGDEVQVGIAYKIPPKSFTSSPYQVKYQLPDGITITEEQSGSVKDPNHSDKDLGTYHISKDGLITIEYNNNFNVEDQYLGTVNVTGKMSLTGSNESGEIHFPGSGTTITVEKEHEQNDSDISVKKEAEPDSDKKSINYKVTVSTTKGTADSVTIKDNISWAQNVNATYDKTSFKLVKKNANVRSEQINSFQVDDDPYNKGIIIKGLPKLNAGESYELSYRVQLKDLENANGDVTVRNYASATSGNKDSSNHDVSTHVSNSMINKTGSVEQGNIHWTVTFNEDGRDIKNYVFTDTLPDEYVPDTFKLVDEDDNYKEISTENLLTYDVYTKKLSINFSKLPDYCKKHKFKLEYSTKAPDISNNSTKKVSNTGDFDGEGHHYSASAKVEIKPNINVSKTMDRKSQNVDEKHMQYFWKSTVGGFEGKDVNEITYYDEIQDAIINNQPEENTHYTYAKTLYDELNENKNLIVKSENYQPLPRDQYIWTLVCYDASGNQINNNDTTQLVHKFKIQITPSSSPLKVKEIELHYSTIGDISKVEKGQKADYKNTATIPYFNNNPLDNVKTEAHQEYKNVKKLEKEASLTGSGPIAGKSTYVSGNLNADYDKMTEENGKKVIYYRLKIYVAPNSGGEIKVTDILPKGMHYVDGSLEGAFYGNEDWIPTSNNNYDFNTQKPSVDKVEKNDGATELTFTVLDGYQANQEQIILLKYKAYISDDYWLDMSKSEKSYTNTATCNDTSVSQETHVERDVKVVQKSGKQKKDNSGKPTNQIEYAIDINPAGNNLNLKGNTLELQDQLSIPGNYSKVKAFLDLNSVKLYSYDSSKSDHRGVLLDSSLYSLQYDSQTHVIKLTIPDEQPCVFVYEYDLDDMSAYVNAPMITNSAKLAGFFSDQQNLQLASTSSSATLKTKEIVIKKVDNDNYSRPLKGADFSVEKLINNNWQSTQPQDITSFNSLTTDDKGELLFTKYDNDVLYRLKETKAPDGYRLDEKPYYFVALENKDANDFFSALDWAIKNEIPGSSDEEKKANIHFLGNEGGTIYVPNTYTKLTIHKNWLNKDGSTDTSAKQPIHLTLWRYNTKLDSVSVTLKYHLVDDKRNKKDYGDVTTFLQVDKGTPLTVTWPQYTTDGIYKVLLNNNPQDHEDLTYTSPKIENDSTIEIFLINYQNDKSSSVQYAEPQAILDQTTAYKQEEFDISEVDNWSKSFTNLPDADSKGNKYVYSVKEEPMAGYDVSYSNNNGIKTGTIQVINKKNNSSVLLPITGGKGTILGYLTGLMFIVATSIVMLWKVKKKYL